MGKQLTALDIQMLLKSPVSNITGDLIKSDVVTTMLLSIIPKLIEKHEQNRALAQRLEIDGLYKFSIEKYQCSEDQKKQMEEINAMIERNLNTNNAATEVALNSICKKLEQFQNAISPIVNDIDNDPRIVDISNRWSGHAKILADDDDVKMFVDRILTEVPNAQVAPKETLEHAHDRLSQNTQSEEHLLPPPYSDHKPVVELANIVESTGLNIESYLDEDGPPIKTEIELNDVVDMLSLGKQDESSRVLVSAARLLLDTDLTELKADFKALILGKLKYECHISEDKILEDINTRNAVVYEKVQLCEKKAELSQILKGIGSVASLTSGLMLEMENTPNPRELHSAHNNLVNTVKPLRTEHSSGPANDLSDDYEADYERDNTRRLT